MVDMWVFKYISKKMLVFSLTMNAILFSVLLVVGKQLNILDIISRNLALPIIVATVFTICWIIRRFFTPSFIRKLDSAMENEKESTFTVMYYLVNQYKKIRLVIFIILFGFASFYLFTYLNLLNVVEFTTDLLPFIWNTILLVAASTSLSVSIYYIENLKENME